MIRNNNEQDIEQLGHRAAQRTKQHDVMEMTMSAQALVIAAQEFLTFKLSDEEYGIDILRVQEIRGYDAVTAIANAPPFIKGVINLRGAIVPIIDLRIRLNMRNITYDQFTVVIILNVRNRTIGIVVDGVSEVIALQPDQIKPPPEFSAAFDTDYLLGLGTSNEQMIILVDIEKMLSSKDLSMVETASAE